MVGILILIAMLALCLSQFSGGPHGFQQPASHLCAAEGKAEETVDSGGLELEFDLVPQGFGLFAVVAESEDRNSAELGPVD
jgi:hypothetical protein